MYKKEVEMTEQIREFLQSGNYINIFIIGFIILINILKEGLILANGNFDELIKNNKELLSEQDVIKANKHITFNKGLVLFARILIWLLVIVLLINMINFI